MNVYIIKPCPKGKKNKPNKQKIMTYLKKLKNCIRIPSTCPWNLPLTNVSPHIQWAAEAQCCIWANWTHSLPAWKRMQNLALLSYEGNLFWQLPQLPPQSCQPSNMLQIELFASNNDQAWSWKERREDKSQRQQCSYCLGAFLQKPSVQNWICSFFRFCHFLLPSLLTLNVSL